MSEAKKMTAAEWSAWLREQSFGDQSFAFVSCVGSDVADSIDALLRERDEALPYMQAVRDAHNGYDPECRKVMPTLREPATPQQALEELNREWERQGDMMCDALAVDYEKMTSKYSDLLAENAALRELLEDLKKALNYDGGTALHPRSVVGKPLMKRLDALLKGASVVAPCDSSTPMARIAGKWPGDESEDEVQSKLDELS